MRKLSILLALVAGLFISEARADFTGKNAAGTTITFKNPGDCTSVVCVPVAQLYDGTNVVTLTTAGADAVSNTLTGVPVYGRTYIYNGTTWDRWQGAVTATLAAETTKVIGTVRVASGGIASGSVASGAVASGAVAAGALAAGAGVDGWDLTQGAIADAAVTAGATGSTSAKLRSISRDVMTTNTWASGTLGAMANYGTSPGAVLVPGVNAFITNTNANGGASVANSSPVVPANQYSNYETVAASQTGQAMGATGATGDYLSHCVIYPVSTSPGVVTVFDNTNAAGTNAIAFAGGASSVSNLSPIPIPVGAFSTAGAWKVTTGTNVIVTCYGKFT